MTSLSAVISAYQTDPDSTFHKLRFGARENSRRLLARIDRDCGAMDLCNINARFMLRQHADWSARGEKVAMSHALVGQVRTVIGFGRTFLEDAQCERLSGILHGMRFANSRPRKERLTFEQANAIRATAHEMGLHSIALAQAIQFECTLRQKDVIGEWVPIAEPGLSDITSDGLKWLRGLQWQEIDGNLILRHVTSKRQKPIEVNLRMAPMVMEELERYDALCEFRGVVKPITGPVVISEASSGAPYHDYQFRRLWRVAATAAGVPAEVFNMDSRSGAISEAIEAGASLEHVRHAATHSQITQTQAYDRSAAKITEGVMQLRASKRGAA